MHFNVLTQYCVHLTTGMILAVGILTVATMTKVRRMAPAEVHSAILRMEARTKSMDGHYAIMVNNNTSKTDIEQAKYMIVGSDEEEL